MGMANLAKGEKRRSALYRPLSGAIRPAGKLVLCESAIWDRLTVDRRAQGATRMSRARFGEPICDETVSFAPPSACSASRPGFDPRKD